MIQVFINGQPAELGRIQFEAQDEPYPGGLSYEIIVDDPEFAGYLGGQVPPSQEGRLDSEVAQSVFMGVNLLRMQSVDAGAAASFNLNTIDSLSIAGSKVRLRGVASPLMSGM